MAYIKLTGEMKEAAGMWLSPFSALLRAILALLLREPSLLLGDAPDESRLAGREGEVCRREAGLSRIPPLLTKGDREGEKGELVENRAPFAAKEKLLNSFISMTLSEGEKVSRSARFLFRFDRISEPGAPDCKSTLFEGALLLTAREE